MKFKLVNWSQHPGRSSIRPLLQPEVLTRCMFPMPCSHSKIWVVPKPDLQFMPLCRFSRHVSQSSFSSALPRPHIISPVFSVTSQLSHKLFEFNLYQSQLLFWALSLLLYFFISFWAQPVTPAGNWKAVFPTSKSNAKPSWCHLYISCTEPPRVWPYFHGPTQADPAASGVLIKPRAASVNSTHCDSCDIAAGLQVI